MNDEIARLRARIARLTQLLAQLDQHTLLTNRLREPDGGHTIIIHHDQRTTLQ
ncbi:hypothetical protein [Bradyrhizobium elkanii]|uniref:hypothetical protein n=1 Tax=Bradyrhizobium elkanii TaxID=29448 RepID=UPI000422AC87|nr:hypothetical protein [Bradyrhizobium elkanii]